MSDSAMASLSMITRRGDFLAAARARRHSTATMLVQGRRRKPDESARGPRVGYTCSKKVGNAVARNRAKRRLRAAAAQRLAPQARDGWDYVLIGRAETTGGAPFTALLEDLDRAIAALHAPRRGKRPAGAAS